jgi:hypothetical protein
MINSSLSALRNVFIAKKKKDNKVQYKDSYFTQYL